MAHDIDRVVVSKSDTTTELAKIPAWRRQMRPARKTMCVNCVVSGETVNRIVPWPGRMGKYVKVSDRS